MNKAMLPLAIAIGVVLLVVLGSGACLMSRYNTLVKQEENIEEKWSQVENVLQRRADLIPNLVNTVKGYADHESEVFSQLAEARSKMGSASGPAEAAEANQGVSSALSRLMAISEDNPELQASDQFSKLQNQLEGTENRISTERRRYNEAVRKFNTSIRTFPNSLLAGSFGFEAKEYFEAEEGAEDAPDVDFE